MVLSTADHRLLYSGQKLAESEVLRWIRDQSPVRKNGQEHCYSYHRELARELANKGVTMPQVLRVKLLYALQCRVQLGRHHLEQGDADANHKYPIEMLVKIATALFPLKEIAMVTRTGAAAMVNDLSLLASRPPAPAPTPTQSLAPRSRNLDAASWRVPLATYTRSIHPTLQFSWRAPFHYGG